MFKVTRIYSDQQGDSHFDEKVILLKEAGAIGAISEKEPVSGIIFREVGELYDYDFHPAPQRQYIILLDGGVEIETSLGVRKTFYASDVILVEDTTGKGHKTKNLESKARKSIFVTI